MKTSQFFISTLKEAPQDAELKSHQLMVRAGYVKRLSSGLYTWMPIGLRVLRKIENIIRDEMNASGAVELLMPAIQPAELWQETGRWQQFGPQMLKINDRHENEFCFGPTHEEVITDIARKELNSYKQLPINFYQIQTKFRDEIRPRFGVMRAREFLMKDAYSFHANENCLQKMYELMFETYNRIFSRIGLQFRSVAADSGAIGGDASHEFHVLADSGEDVIAYSDQSEYAANIEKASTVFKKASKENKVPTEKVHTPEITTIEALQEFFKIDTQSILKAVVFNHDDELVICFVPGNREINLVKLEKVIGSNRFRVAKDEELKKHGLIPGFIGPEGNEHIRKLFDHSIIEMENMVCGANEEHYHFKNFQLSNAEKFVDITNVVEGDVSPDESGKLKFCRGIEVGHIFQLGKKYSESMQASILNEEGKSQTMTMGCYGIGVSRIVAAAIEQNNDENGMILPKSIAPFELIIVPIGYHKNDNVRTQANKIYADLLESGIDVILDDRDARPGIMFAESDLIGIPNRLVIGEKSLNENKVEFKSRTESNPEMINIPDLIQFIKSKI
ncbi:MAG: proline--tRNA ligase [Methylophilaceae bacterium]